MAAAKDYYATLGVERTASTAEIKKAFRRKARESHPDVAGDDGAEERFKEINEAYEVLSDPEKRQMYDRFGTADPRQVGYGGGVGDVGDFFGGFEDLFSVFMGGMGNVGSARVVRTEGRDMRARLTVTLLEAAEGAERELTIRRPAPCAACDASGAAPGGEVKSCPDCRGTGQRRTQRRTILGVMQSVTACERCGATGRVAEPPCPECKGSGRAMAEDTVSVLVPAGVMDGTTLRIPEKGEAGLRGARAGDLLVTITVLPHEFLLREGDDLHEMVPVNIAQAALGATITVPGLFGDVDVAFGGGAQSGDVVRVKGEGMPKVRGAGRGDLIVHLKVEVPRKLDKRQKELLSELGETFGTETGRPTPLDRLKDWLTG